MKRASRSALPLSDKTGLFPAGHFQVRSHSFFLFTKSSIDKVEQTAACLNSFIDKFIREHITGTLLVGNMAEETQILLTVWSKMHQRSEGTLAHRG